MVGGRNKNKKKIHSDHFPNRRKHESVFPSILIQLLTSVFPSILIQLLENVLNEFYFQFNQPGCSRKDKRKIPVQYWHGLEGNTKIKLKKISFFFFFSIFKKLGQEGR